MSEPAPQAEGQAAQAAPEAQGQATLELAPTETNWYDGAPDEIKGYVQNKGWDDPIKTVEAYQNLEKFHGVPADQLLKLPKEGEPMDAIYDRLGRPDAPEKYEWSAPEGFSLEDGRFDMYKNVAHEAGISQAQFEKLANADAEYWQGVQKSHFEDIAKSQEVELNGLKKEWGTGFEERQEMGRRFVAKNVPEGMDATETLNKIESAIGTAAMLKLFANAGERSGVREDSIPEADGDRPFGYTPEQAKADKKELMQAIQADPKRLQQYNSGAGNDFDKMRQLNSIIVG